MIPSEDQLDFTMKLFDLNQVRQRTALYGRVGNGAAFCAELSEAHGMRQRTVATHGCADRVIGSRQKQHASSSSSSSF